MSHTHAARAEVGTTVVRATRIESRRYWRSVKVVAISQAATVSLGVGRVVRRHCWMRWKASPARRAAYPTEPSVSTAAAPMTSPTWPTESPS
jgi:hypothetical protein